MNKIILILLILVINKTHWKFTKSYTLHNNITPSQTKIRTYSELMHDEKTSSQIKKYKITANHINSLKKRNLKQYTNRQQYFQRHKRTATYQQSKSMDQYTVEMIPIFKENIAYDKWIYFRVCSKPFGANEEQEYAKLEPQIRVYLTRSSCSLKDKNRPTFDIRYHLIVYLDHSIVATYDLYRKRTYIYYTELKSNFYFWSHNSGNIVLFAFRPLSTHQNQYFRVEISMLPLSAEWLSNINMLDFNIDNYHKNGISIHGASTLVNFRLKFKQSTGAPIEFKFNSNESLQLYQLYSNILMNTTQNNDDSNSNVENIHTYLENRYNQLIKITNQLINYKIPNPLLISDLMDELIILESEYQMNNISEGVFFRKKNTLKKDVIDSTNIQTTQLALIYIIPIGTVVNMTCRSNTLSMHQTGGDIDLRVHYDPQIWRFMSGSIIQSSSLHNINNLKTIQLTLKAVLETWNDYYDYNSSLLINIPQLKDYTVSLVCKIYENNQLNVPSHLIGSTELSNQYHIHFAIVPKEIYQSLVERQQNKYDMLFGNVNVRKYYSQYFSRQKHPIILQNQSINSQDVVGHYNYDNHLSISVNKDNGLWNIHMLRLSTMKFMVIICSLVVVVSLILFIIREVIKIRRFHNMQQDNRTTSVLGRRRITETTTPAAGEVSRNQLFPPPRCSSVDIYDLFRSWLYPSLTNNLHGTGDEAIRHPGSTPMPNRQRRNAQLTTNVSSHLINEDSLSVTNSLNGNSGNSSSRSSNSSNPQPQTMSTSVEPHQPNPTQQNRRNEVNQMKQTDQATIDFHDLPPSYELVEKLKQLQGAKI